jgi:hypothetical protein
MKNFTAYMTIMTFGIFVTFNAAMAAERVKVFELAESGQTFEFPATTARPALELQDTETAKGNSADNEVSAR